MITWWHRLAQMVPPDLAWCEFECRVPTCEAERFDACDRRLEYVARHLAYMQLARQDGTSSTPRQEGRGDDGDL